MIIKSVVPIVKDVILELREQGKSDDEILQVLLDPENVDMMFSESEIEADQTFNMVDHMDTINEAFRQVSAEKTALFSHPAARGMKTRTKLMIAGGCVVAAGALAYWLRGNQTSFLVPPSY